MGEPTTDHTTDQEPTIRPTLTFDTRHTYRGFWDDGGICRLRIFEAEGEPPVFLLTELAENENTSITNLIEHLAPEMVKAYRPLRVHESPPAIFLEHYDEILNNRRRRSGPSVSRVSFTHMRPTVVSLNGVNRLSYGDPSWAPLDAVKLSALIGEGVDLDD